MYQRSRVCKRDITYALASQVEILALEFGEDLKELLHEANELRRQILLILSFTSKIRTVIVAEVYSSTHLNIGRSLRETCSDRLVDPKNAGQIGPAKWILSRFRLSILPTDWLWRDGDVNGE